MTAHAAVRHPDNIAASPALSATGVTVRFGGLAACADVSIVVPQGAMVGLVGPNGAGKSTLFSVLSGLRRPTAGQVFIGGRDATRVSARARSRLGLARTFQQPELFTGLTVREHLVLAHRSRHAAARLWADLLVAGALRGGTGPEDERVDYLIDALYLRDVEHQLAGTLPLGTSRLLEVGRALATDPSVLLLDEPLSGLDEHEAEGLARTLRRVNREEGVAMLLVEHDVAMVLSTCSSIVVLDFGVVIATGTPEEVRTDPRVRAASLGDEPIDVPDPDGAT